MAPPVYANDLTTIATGDLSYDAGTFDESTDGGWDTAGGPVDDLNLIYTNNSINTGEADDSCTSNQYTKDGIGAGTTGPGTMLYVHNAAFTVPTDGIVSIDNFWTAPPALNPYAGTFGVAEAGVSVLIGDSFADFDVHYVAGSDKYPATDGVYTTYFVDPTVTPAGTVGAPTVLQAVGIATAAVAQARGNPSAIQSIRYGRAEVSYTEGDTATPANFEGYAVLDNAVADKFNLLLRIEGSLKARGLMTFGTAATAVYFKDSDKSIVIADDLKVGPNFNKGVVNNASSELHWTNISIKNLGTVAKYSFKVNDNAITTQTGGVLEDIGTFEYGSNSTQAGVTYRRQELVSQLGSTFNVCTFDKPIGTVGLLVDNLNIVTKNIFNSKGTGHAINLGTISSTISITYDNTDTGYTASSSGNETIVVSVASGVTLTINVAAGATTPSIYNIGLGTVLVVSGQATVTQKVLDDTTLLPISSAAVTLKVSDTAGAGLPYQESVTITSTGGIATVTHVGHGIANEKKVAIDGANENEYNRIKTITFIDADSYSYPITGTPASPATGTIVATAVLIDGRTDSSGEISDTRSYGVNQPFTGLVQKGTGLEIYKQRNTTGTVDSASGISQTTLLTKD